MNIDFPFAVHVCDRLCNVMLAYLSYRWVKLVLRSRRKILMTSVMIALFKTLQISIDVYQLSMYTQCPLCNNTFITVSPTLVAW